MMEHLYHQMLIELEFMRPDATTMGLLSAHVVNGGTIFEFADYNNADQFEHPLNPANFNRGIIPSLTTSFISQLIFDLGGIIGPNNGWKYATSATSRNGNPTTFALNNMPGITVSNPYNRAAAIVNSKSRGQSVLNGSDSSAYSVAHIWDGNLGHLNSGVKGKIIYLGTKALIGGNLTSLQNVYREGLSIPLLNYVAANRQS